MIGNDMKLDSGIGVCGKNGQSVPVGVGQPTLRPGRPDRRRHGRVSVDMCGTCDHPDHMSRMIQLRNVPDELHRKLKARAATAGLSLSDFLTREARRAIERVSDDEIWRAWLSNLR